MPDKLQEAISAIKAGDKTTGKQLLIAILQSDQRNEYAWLWMTQVVDSDDERIKYLQNVLKINPNNESAKRGLSALQEQQADKPLQVEPPDVEPEPATQAKQPKKIKSLAKPEATNEELDLNKVYDYVVKVLDDFGMKKWGEGRQGCRFSKGRLYGVYYWQPVELRRKNGEPVYSFPKWAVLCNKGKVYRKAKPIVFYKYPSYTVELRPNESNPKFKISCGGYTRYDGYTDVFEDMEFIELKVSEKSLKRALAGILAEGYEPGATLTPNLTPSSQTGRGVKRIL